MAMPETPARMVHQYVAFAAMVIFFLVAPLFIYPVFLMTMLCFALFACAFNLLIGYAGLLSSATRRSSAAPPMSAVTPPRSGACRRSCPFWRGPAPPRCSVSASASSPSAARASTLP